MNDNYKALIERKIAVIESHQLEMADLKSTQTTTLYRYKAFIEMLAQMYKDIPSEINEFDEFNHLIHDYISKCYHDAVNSANELFNNRRIGSLGPEENYKWNVLIREINRISL